MRFALPAAPVVTGFYRMFFAALVLAGVLLVTRRRIRWRGRAAALAVAAGACFGSDLALWSTSLIHTSVGLATLLVNITPLHVGLFSFFALGQRLEGRFVAGAGLAILGCAALLGVPREAVGSTGPALALAASLFYAGYLLLMRAARSELDALSALVLMTVSAAAVQGVYGLALGHAFAGFPASSWAAMLGLALVSQLGGVLGIVWVLRYLPATTTSVVLIGQPVGTAILGWLLLGEALGPLDLAGGLTVLAGIALAARQPVPLAPVREAAGPRVP